MIFSRIRNFEGLYPGVLFWIARICCCSRSSAPSSTDPSRTQKKQSRLYSSVACLRTKSDSKISSEKRSQVVSAVWCGALISIARNTVNENGTRSRSSFWYISNRLLRKEKLSGSEMFLFSRKNVRRSGMPPRPERLSEIKSSILHYYFLFCP